MAGGLPCVHCRDRCGVCRETGTIGARRHEHGKAAHPRRERPRAQGGANGDCRQTRPACFGSRRRRRTSGDGVLDRAERTSPVSSLERRSGWRHGRGRRNDHDVEPRCHPASPTPLDDFLGGDLRVDSGELEMIGGRADLGRQRIAAAASVGRDVCGRSRARHSSQTVQRVLDPIRRRRRPPTAAGRYAAGLCAIERLPNRCCASLSGERQTLG